jgi:hypothetical protein
MRSRTVSRSPARWRAIRSGPPISCARAIRERSSSSSGSQLSGVAGRIGVSSGIMSSRAALGVRSVWF